MRGELVLGTRGSTLALAQTALVADALRARHPALHIRVERITTTGDARADVSLAQLGRGVFVTEIETALRDGRIDAAVHSAKDLPSTLAHDLCLAALLPRADARDVLVSRAGTLRELPVGARIGTSSPRRMCQIRVARPDLLALEVRGNVDTRLRHLAEGRFDAIVLAAAGLARLGRLDAVTEWLDAGFAIPCVGQGAIAVEARADDAGVMALLAALDDAATRRCVLAERAFLAELGAGCRAAVAAHAVTAGDELHLCAMIGAPDGRLVRGARRGHHLDHAELGAGLARELLLAGGAALLAEGPSALRGRRVAITRPEAQSDALSALLQARGAEPVPCPTVAIEPLTDASELDAALRGLDRAQWLAFTSTNAVSAVCDRLAALGLAVPPHVRLAAVGRATAALAGRLLRRADFVPSRATAEQLALELPIEARDLVIFPRADIAAPALSQGLARRGAIVRDVVAYRTVRGSGARVLASLVRENVLDAIVFTSPSSVKYAEGIAEAMRDAGDSAPRVVCMGPSTSRAARERGIRGKQPATQAVGALVETLERWFATREPAVVG